VTTNSSVRTAGHSAAGHHAVSQQTRIWDVRRIGDTSKGRYRVRWTVDGREYCKSYLTKPQADDHVTALRKAARAGWPFDPATGVPLPPGRPSVAATTTWYEHACAFATMKWPALAPKSRRSQAEALTTVTIALCDGPAPPDPATLRRALFAYTFNPGRAQVPRPPEIAAALAWAQSASPSMAALESPEHVRAALDACARRLDGKPAAATTIRRKRAVFSGALGYAVERELLTVSPLPGIRWRAVKVAGTVDRRCVASPAIARDLLAAVRAQGDVGQRMEAFYAVIYYAGLRPSEAIDLNVADCTLPGKGWGRIDLHSSLPRAGTEWTSNGASRERRGLKHRADNETRPIPIPPVLVAILRAHIERHGTGPDGRIFRTARGNPLNDTGYTRVWKRARARALAPAQQATPLAARVYDLRHACLSLWLSAGVDAPEVARRAGHSVHVLLQVYANCIDGQADTANARIATALGD
jgi:integrase